MISFRRSVGFLAKRLKTNPPKRRASVCLGDARSPGIPEGSVDSVITSPPYLNAIDYLRGHRMSLVWMGYSLRHLREIRGAEVGAERALSVTGFLLNRTLSQMGDVQELPARTQGMARRYVTDTDIVVSSVAKTLRPGGRALFVVGNSSLRGVFLRNDKTVEIAADGVGLQSISRTERELPLIDVTYRRQRPRGEI
jgi:hypothetical protein